MKMLGGYLEFFMKPELATVYLSIKEELGELVQNKVHLGSGCSILHSILQ